MPPTGILCLETIWFDEVDHPSTRYLLELLKSLSGTQYVYRDISTAEELKFHLGRWVGRDVLRKHFVFRDYRILYLGFHGSPGEIALRDGRLNDRADDDEVNVGLDEIADYLLEEAKDQRLNYYDCSGCVIHFASCSVLRSCARVREFKDKVRAAGVSGFKKNVDSVLAWSFELMYLDLLSRRTAWNSGTLDTLLRRIKDKPEYGGLAKHLGFEIVF